MRCLFCVFLCIVCVYMCTELLPPGGYPIAVKYIILYHISYHIYHIISYHIIYHIISYIISYLSQMSTKLAGSQEPLIGHFLRPAESSPHSYTTFSLMHINIIRPSKLFSKVNAKFCKRKSEWQISNADSLLNKVATCFGTCVSRLQTHQHRL
jgi:hypothetical protein